MKLCVIGSTGLVGSKFLESLHGLKNIERVTSISRRSLDLRPDLNVELEELVIRDLRAESLSGIKTDSEVFVCCLGTTIKAAGSKKAFENIDYEMVLAFAKLAETSSAKALFVVSALGADASSKIFYNQVKGRMEREVAKLNIASVYFLRPSLLVGERTESRALEVFGIGCYKLLRTFFSQSQLRLFGTPVDSICHYLAKGIVSPKKGVHYIERF